MTVTTHRIREICVLSFLHAESPFVQMVITDESDNDFQFRLCVNEINEFAAKMQRAADDLRLLSLQQKEKDAVMKRAEVAA